jgi:putative membrane protein
MQLSRLVVAWAVNAGALWVASALFDGFHIHGWAAYLIGSAVLGVANAILKPLLAILTLPLIIVTLGISYFLINVAMLALAAWIAPSFSIHGFWTYVGAVVVIWAVNWIADRLIERPERRSRMRVTWTRG